MIHLEILDNNLLANMYNELVLKMDFSEFGSIMVIGKLFENYRFGEKF